MSINPHPALPEFEYLRPQTLLEASEFLTHNAKEALPFLGGTDIFVRMRDRFISPKYLVDVKNLDGMNELRFDSQEGLVIGAAVNMNRVIASPDVQANYPLLVEACRTVASYQLRTRATIIGNVCNASPAGDTIGACLVLDGKLHIHGINGQRQESLVNFFVGPGKTTLKAGDIVTAIQFPPSPRGAVGKYIKLGRNKMGDLAIVGVTALGYPDNTSRSNYRFHLALASVAPIPLVASEVELYLAEHPITPQTIQEAGHIAAESCSPIDDVRASARYRKQMVKNLTVQAIREIWENLKEYVH